MSREAQVRFCERRGARLPPPTLLIAGFEHLGDARQFLRDLRDRFARFCLELHPGKTRLIEFGRFAAVRRAARGAGKSERRSISSASRTSAGGKTRAGRFQVRRITISKRMRAKLKEVKDQLKQRRHEPVPEQGRWLGSVVRGHMAYYAVPGNIRAVRAFRTQVTRHWRGALQSRSQRGYLNWNRMNRLATRWLPPPRILHPYLDERFHVRTRGRSPVR
jgi:RNA-directed DNA polymerase